MRTVFADTYYFIALVNPSDEHHGAAGEFTAGFAGGIVLTADHHFEQAGFAILLK